MFKDINTRKVYQEKTTKKEKSNHLIPNAQMKTDLETESNYYKSLASVFSHPSEWMLKLSSQTKWSKGKNWEWKVLDFKSANR